jgi:hypothetical protein
MRFPRKQSRRTVRDAGAPAGSILCGVGVHNGGLRLRVLEEQPAGAEGPIRGEFVILDVGDNMHADALWPLLHWSINAVQVVCAIRARHPGCVSAVNTNILVAEQQDTAPRLPERAGTP